MAPYLSTMRNAGGQRPNAPGQTFIPDYHEAIIKMMDKTYHIVDQMDPMGALVDGLEMPMEDMQRFFDFAQYKKDRIAEESTKATASTATTPLELGLGTTAPGKASPIAAPMCVVNDCTDSGMSSTGVTTSVGPATGTHPASSAQMAPTAPTIAGGPIVIMEACDHHDKKKGGVCGALV